MSGACCPTSPCGKSWRECRCLVPSHHNWSWRQHDPKAQWRGCRNPVAPRHTNAATQRIRRRVLLELSERAGWHRGGTGAWRPAWSAPVQARSGGRVSRSRSPFRSAQSQPPAILAFTVLPPTRPREGVVILLPLSAAASPWQLTRLLEKGLAGGGGKGEPRQRRSHHPVSLHCREPRQRAWRRRPLCRAHGFKALIAQVEVHTSPVFNPSLSFTGYVFSSRPFLTLFLRSPYWQHRMQSIYAEGVCNKKEDVAAKGSPQKN